MEVKKPLQLALYALLVMSQCGFVQQVTLCRLTARVSYHARCTSDERDRLVPATLQVPQHHDSTKVPDMQTVRSGVNTHIGGGYFLH